MLVMPSKKVERPPLFWALSTNVLEGRQGKNKHGRVILHLDVHLLLHSLGRHEALYLCYK